MSPKPGPAGPAKPAPVVRGKAEEDPFHLANQRKRPDGPAREEKKPSGPGNGDKGRAGGERSGAARRLVERAEEEFGRKRYASARLLYEGAHQADRAVIAEASQDHWAYCKLHYVVEQLNQAGAAPPCWADLEREVRVALTLAPKLDKYGQGLLQEIRERSRGAATAADGGDVQVRHFPRNAQGWASAETSHFRVFHNQPRELAERVARAAEQTRVAMTRKWFGKPGEEWNPRCDVYLHPDAKEYSRLTGQPASSPGHSRIETDSGRVVSRRIDLRCDAPGLLVSVLPHETTHVVLAGQFGKYQVPRWADEGMAVLTEPAERVDQHRKNLARCRQDGLLFDVRELLRLENYPEPRRVSAFYAQSVSLVDFLTRQRGAVAFSQFLRQALEEGYEPALRRHYNLRDLNDLQASWARQAFAESTYAAGLIGRAR
jgi:hypothetical protein